MVTLYVGPLLCISVKNHGKIIWTNNMLIYKCVDIISGAFISSDICNFQAFFGHSHFYSTCGHGDEGLARDPLDYKLALDNLVDYMEGIEFGDKCNKDVKRVFNVILDAKGELRKKTDLSEIEKKYKIYEELPGVQRLVLQLGQRISPL